MGFQIPGRLVIAIIEIRHEPSLYLPVCARCWQVVQVACIQQATGNVEVECEGKVTLHS